MKALDDTAALEELAAASWELMEQACREYDEARAEVRTAELGLFLFDNADAKVRLDVARARLQRAERRVGG